MSRHNCFKQKYLLPPSVNSFSGIDFNASQVTLGVMLLVSSLAVQAQTSASAERTLKPVTVKEAAEAPEGKDSVRATESTIGKGKQQLRDIPQSITVVTEKLMDDRNYDTMKEVLKATGGVSFLAAEGGEEDIRLRGFALQSTGDVFVDGMRDPAFYDRDTFALDRLEILRGSASLLFGRGSTGGAVNMVTKVPRLIDEHQVDVTLGSHQYRRVVGDFNLKTGESAALRINAMSNTADNNGAGSSIDKKGIAATYRHGIGEKNEISASLYHLDNQNGMNYGMPWIRPTPTSPASATTVLPLDPTAYYGMASDRNAGSATYFTLSHTHRFDRDNEITTKVRKGAYERDQRAGTVRFGAANTQPGGAAVSLATFGPSTVITRGTQLKIQDLDNLYAQSDFSGKFEALGYKHEMQAGVDFAQEEKVVYGARSVAQGGVVPTKPTTSVGRENDGAWIDESARVLRETSRYKSKGFGAYVQDLVQVAPHWKVLGGLRYDNLTGDYDTYAIPNTAAGPVTTTGYRMKVSEVSKRVGVLYQPNALHSYHFSAATSFNTSGDAYSLGATNVNTPPEQSINIEFGGKLDSTDRQWTTRFAVFRSTKLHERNTDPLVNLVTLSGKRHVAGVEVDVTGRLSPKWEIFGSYMWMPVANIDEGVAGSEGQGTRPSLTPYHSGTVWSTYQITPQLRVGGGLNFRGRQTPNRNPGWEVPSWVTADLMAEYEFDFDKLTLKANLSNITNKLYADSLYSGHYIPGAGRMFQLTANLKF
ncbi:MAG TPA: TonB-dependent siderophore receptor [Burkholderiaceae bacterium]|nr:TonB-dependent siderophore receptor [Burkholderiaceae bacterium]